MNEASFISLIVFTRTRFINYLFSSSGTTTGILVLLDIYSKVI